MSVVIAIFPELHKILSDVKREVQEVECTRLDLAHSTLVPELLELSFNININILHFC